MISYTYLKAAAILVIVDMFWLLTGGIYARNMTERIQGSPLRARYIGAVVVYACSSSATNYIYDQCIYYRYNGICCL